MSSTLFNWILAGALAASVTLHALRPASPRGEQLPVTAVATRCEQLDTADLGLSEAQVARLESTCRERCAEVARLDAEIRDASARLEELLRADPIDVSRATALAEELGDLRRSSVVRSVEAVLSVRGVLDREQLGRLLDCCLSGCSE